MWPLEQNVILLIGLGTSYFDTCWNWKYVKHPMWCTTWHCK